MASGRTGKLLLQKYNVTKDMLAHLNKSDNEDSVNSDESLEEYWTQLGLLHGHV